MERSSFILPWNLIGQRETKFITSLKSFPGSSLQKLPSAETSDSRKYVCVRRLSNCEMFIFYAMSYMKQNTHRKQTLEGVEYGPEIIFGPGTTDSRTARKILL